MLLRDLAHSRAGDKGDISCISVIAHSPGDYPLLLREVTAERVQAHFADIVRGGFSTPLDAPMIPRFPFAFRDVEILTLTLDAHGKCLASKMLEIDLGG